MGKTLVEKIVARNIKTNNISIGDFVNVKPDLVVLRDIYWPPIRKFFNEIGTDKVWNSKKIAVVIDHTVMGAIDPPYLEAHYDQRKWVIKQGIRNFYDIGRGGLGQQVIVEEGHIVPGMLIITEEPDYNNVGVFGVMNIALGWDVYVSILTGEDWFRVPKTVRINLNSRFKGGASARDLGQILRRDTSMMNISDKALEYGGEGYKLLNIDERQNLLALYGAWAVGIAETDAVAIEYIKKFIKNITNSTLSEIYPDHDAEYAEVKEYDLSEIRPQIAVPGDFISSIDVANVIGKNIDAAYIGSCASGRINDIRAVAAILKNKKIAEGVRLVLSPQSQKVLKQARKEGLIDIIEDAGGIVIPGGCNMCWGYVFGLASKEVCITSTQVNYSGRMGAEDAEIYMASPATVAASAIKGYITDPSDLLEENLEVIMNEKSRYI